MTLDKSSIDDLVSILVYSYTYRGVSSAHVKFGLLHPMLPTYTLLFERLFQKLVDTFCSCWPLMLHHKLNHKI
jgi:hypothetical protein